MHLRSYVLSQRTKKWNWIFIKWDLQYFKFSKKEMRGKVRKRIFLYFKFLSLEIILGREINCLIIILCLSSNKFILFRRNKNIFLNKFLNYFLSTKQTLSITVSVFDLFRIWFIPYLVYSVFDLFRIWLIQDIWHVTSSW